MKKKSGGIYATHENERLLFVKAIVNGVLCAAYVKNGELISYEPWDSINQQMDTGPCLKFEVSEKPTLDQPDVLTR